MGESNENRGEAIVTQKQGELRRSESRTLFDVQLDLVALQGGSFIEGQLGQGLVVVCQGLNLRGARGGEIALELQDEETGALARFHFFLFGLQRGLGKDARLP